MNLRTIVVSLVVLAFICQPAWSAERDHHLTAAMTLKQRIEFLEDSLFNKTFPGDNIPDRLIRLENTVFPKRPAPEDMSLPERVDRLTEAMGESAREHKRTDQSEYRSDSAASAAASLGPLSSYCDKVQSRLREKWKYEPLLDKSITVDFGVDPDGRIFDIVVSADTPTPRKEAASTKIVELDKVDPPPPTAKMPFRLGAVLSNKLDDILVKVDSIEFDEYMSQVQRKIKEHWHPPKQKLTKSTTTIFKIWRDGHVSDITVSKSSGSCALDDGAVAAINKAAPFQELPDGSPAQVDIKFNFDYNVFNKGKLVGAGKSARSSQPAESSQSGESRDLAVTSSDIKDNALELLYVKPLRTRVYRAWFPPKGAEDKELSVIFTVSRDGVLSDLRIDRSSGDQLADQSALRAVENAAPFKPLPSDAGERCEVRMTFSKSLAEWHRFGRVKEAQPHDKLAPQRVIPF